MKHIVSIRSLSMLLAVLALCAGTLRAEEEAKPSIQDAFGATLINAQGEEVDTASLAGKKIGLYFSAQWCPPCRAFTPVLVQTYNELKEQGKPFELIFVSSDRSEEAMFKYMADYGMNWLALPFGDARRAALRSKHGVRGIPTLIIVDENGQTLSANGTAEVSAHGAAAFDNW